MVSWEFVVLVDVYKVIYTSKSVIFCSLCNLASFVATLPEILKSLFTFLSALGRTLRHSLLQIRCWCTVTAWVTPWTQTCPEPTDAVPLRMKDGGIHKGVIHPYKPLSGLWPPMPSSRAHNPPRPVRHRGGTKANIVWSHVCAAEVHSQPEAAAIGLSDARGNVSLITWVHKTTVGTKAVLEPLLLSLPRDRGH